MMNSNKFKNITNYTQLVEFDEIISIETYQHFILEIEFLDKTKKKYDLPKYINSDDFYIELEKDMNEVKQKIREEKLNRIMKNEF